MNPANEAWSKAQERKYYPHGKRRFEARQGTHTVVLWAGGMVEAYDRFEGWYSEANRHLAWEWVIEETDDRPDELVQFLRQAGQKGGQAKPTKE